MVLKQVFSREPGTCGLQNFEEVRIGDLKQVFSREPGTCGLQNFEEVRIGDLKQVFSREPGTCGLQNFEECSILGPFSFSSLTASGTSPKSQARLNLPFPGPMYKRSNFCSVFMSSRMSTGGIRRSNYPEYEEIEILGVRVDGGETRYLIGYEQWVSEDDPLVTPTAVARFFDQFGMLLKLIKRT